MVSIWLLTKFAKYSINDVYKPKLEVNKLNYNSCGTVSLSFITDYISKSS